LRAQARGVVRCAGSTWITTFYTSLSEKLKTPGAEFPSLNE
jgi:hypothetical protein